MQIIEVTDRITVMQFLETARILYRYDSSWVCPLDQEIESRFNKLKNPYFSDGGFSRWILKDAENKLIGRIAAFYNEKKKKEDPATGGIGFFECIDNLDASRLLFDTAREWLKKHGLEAMDGPVNPGENDSFWGCLVNGFTQPGFGMPYNFPYYQKLFENYGFRTYFEQYSYHLDVQKTFPDRFWRIANWVMSKPGYSFQHFTFREEEKFIADMVSIYNESWSVFKDDYTPMDPDVLRETLRKARPIIDEEIIWFAYHNGEPIAFFVMFPDINQVIKPFRGKMNFINMIRFLYFKNSGKITRARALVAGVVPRFQNSGIESAIFSQYNKVIPPKKKYREIELSWVGDYNPKMQSLYKAVDAIHAKTHITYRYLFDPGKKFERFMPELSVKR